jgi:hypothetical protein
MSREESPWYCPNCGSWIGWKLDTCLNGHDRPRLPLRYDDVEFDHSAYVSWRHRTRGKIRSLLGKWSP